DQRGLAPQHVKVLRRGAAVDQAQVDVRGRLENPLGTRARVFGPLAFVSVRQEKNERSLEVPFRSRRGDELVEHHLRAVEEVTVLRLPDNEAVRLVDVVAKLEANGGVLRQRAVVNFERRPGSVKRLERNELLPGVHIMKDRVAMAERAALGIFAGQTNR